MQKTSKNESLVAVRESHTLVNKCAVLFYNFIEVHLENKKRINIINKARLGL